MTNAGTTSPAIARRRVSLALRRARQAKSWTQTQVANAMEWSLSKVMRIEKGQVNISPNDLRAVLQLLDVTDADQVDELLADARVSRNERYANDEFDREHLTPAMIRLFQYETVATAILFYSNVTVPGSLQTSDYATAIFANQVDRLDSATIEARLESRLRRAERAIYRDPPPEFRIILDESVLRRQVGGRTVMADQLSTLLAMSDEGRIRVRICPLQADTPILFLGPFILLDLDGPDDTVLYRESPAQDEILIGSTEVKQHRDVFERLWSAVLDETASRELISAVRHEMQVGQG